MPHAWPQVQEKALATLSDPQTKAIAQSLGLAFGDPTVFDELFVQAANAKADNSTRAAALELLIQSPNPKLIPLLQKVISDPELAGPALRGLASYDDPQTAEAIIAAYGKLTDAQREDAISTLASHAGSAIALLDAIAAKRINSADVSAYTARQLLDYSDTAITDRVRELWGHVRTTPAEKQQKIAAFRSEFSSDNLAAADLKAGRQLFKSKCAQCHTLYGEGGKIGPDLTGSQRNNLDYLLPNVVDPSAVVPREYAVYTVLTAEGRLVQGVVPEQNERVMVLQTPTERIVIDRNDIDEVKPASLSMMPEGLLESLTPAERRDLVGYLSTPSAPASE
jgi:putative heme-binding domain-containing protein